MSNTHTASETPTTQENSNPLPPDPDGMNDDRAPWAGAAIAKFMDLTGTDLEDALCDLMCDLMHWSDRQDFGFEAALDRARYHYEAETIGEAMA
jgi:hypothetical protein